MDGLAETVPDSAGSIETPLPMALFDDSEQQLQNAFGSLGGVRDRPGFDFYSPTAFKNAFQIPGTNVFIKPGGYVKADFIQDFDAIGSPDNFVVREIPTDGTDFKNARFHARQSRFGLDTRWVDETVGPLRVYFEGDFFSEGNRFRLRHAYGTFGRFLAGQTWTTFTDVNALPMTLDLESSVAFVARRQGQIRYTAPLGPDGWTWSFAIEDPRNIIAVPSAIAGEPRTPIPDFCVFSDRQLGRRS